MIVATYHFVKSQLDRQDNFLDESQHLKDTDERYGPNLPKSPNLSIFAELLTLNGRKSTRLVLDDGQKEAYEDADEVAHEVVDRNARPRKTSRQKEDRPQGNRSELRSFRRRRQRLSLGAPRSRQDTLPLHIQCFLMSPRIHSYASLLKGLHCVWTRVQRRFECIYSLR